MPKFSPSQPNTAAHIFDVMAHVEALAAHASTTDKELVAIAKRAAHFASVWVRCTTEAGRRDMLANSSRLVERALAETQTPLSFACVALGNAFRHFAACDYRAANQSATHARKVAGYPQATIDAAMAE